ncbi:MAG: UDP-N-acetylmuramate dehydrogenase [Bdellovibrionales bacterium]|nr:UDP-N-acetylmuramate dehydrogenase [Bdellovibrionales bacterium]
MRILEHEPLARHTTWRIGGPARYLAFPRTEGDLSELGRRIQGSGEPFFVLGNGSNVLAPDEGFPGWVIKATDFCADVEFPGECRVRAGAGAPNSRLIRLCADRGLAGLEFLSGVPGTLGGAVAMNAGTSRDWIGSVLLEVRGWSLTAGPRIHAREGLRFSYRRNHFLARDELVTGATLQLRAGAPEEIRARLAEMARRRKEAQPVDLPSCGSVFRNPEGTSAWRLIEAAGLRGFRHGGAEISAKHCNFIVNQGGATAADVRFLIRLAKSRVRETAGIELEEEVREIEPRWLGRKDE